MWARCRLEGLDELPDDCDVEGPGLLGRGDDLVSGQQEPKATCVTTKIRRGEKMILVSIAACASAIFISLMPLKCLLNDFLLFCDKV